MLALTTEQKAALESRAIMVRVFIWSDAKDPDTGLPDPAGFWNDVGDVTVGERVYHGDQSVISLSPVTGKSDLSIPDLTITLSGLDVNAIILARVKALSQTPIEVAVGLFDPASHELLPPLFPVFVGFTDDIEIPTPEVGGDSSIILTCRSVSRALTRISTATRSHASEIERDPSDQFYVYSPLGRVPTYFGRPNPAQVTATTGQGGFSGGIARA
jgi:hypothetical protein